MVDPSADGVFGSELGDAKEIDTEPLYDTVEFDNSLIENQVDIVHQDTEVLHNLDPVENLETQLLEGYDTEVVLDSDDEVLDTAESKRFSRRSGNYSESIVGDSYKVKPYSHPSCEQYMDSNVNVDACNEEGHFSGQAADMIICDGNDNSSVIVKSCMPAKELHLKDCEIAEARDKDLGSSVACHIGCADIKQPHQDVKVDENGDTTQLKMRKISIVYTRKRKRTTCTFEDKGLEGEIRSPLKCDEHAGLSYVESQEPEDISKALLFVDQYVCVNVMHSSPVADVNIKEKSPPALSAKGAQNLVRWANHRNKSGGTGIFEWDQSGGQSHSSDNRVQLDFGGKKFGQIYMRRSLSVRDMIPKKHGKPGILQEDKAENFNNKEEFKDLAQSDAKLAADDFINTESEHVFDVGIDTQMAAEAIQALSYAAPAGSSDGDANPCTHVQVWSCPKKARSASRGIVNWPKNGWKNDILQASNLEVTRDRGKLVTGECLNKNSFKDSGKDLFTKESKKRAKRAHMDGCKENFNLLISGEDMPLCNVKCQSKHRDIHLHAQNLNSSSLFNMNEGLMNESMGGKIVDVKVVSNDKRKGMGVIERGGISANMLDFSDVKGICLEPSCISDAGNAKSEDMWYALTRPGNWYLGDYPRGKRTCRSMLGRCERSSDVDYSSVTQGKCSHCPSRSQSNSDSSFSLSSYGSSMKRKQRSSVYISPCWLSSQKSRSPNCPLKDEMVFTNVINGYYEQPCNKKAKTSPLTRELVRLGVNESMPEFTQKGSRRRKTMANIQVLLSQNLDKGKHKQQKKILRRLGIPMASCPADATHFVTEKFARTRNMLEFIAQGKPVVTHLWLESCEQAGFYIDERNYILRDVKKELELGFRLPLSLDKARNHPLLEGYWVVITPNTQPEREMLTSLVKASHGQAVDAPVDSAMKDKMVLENLLILSCEKDRAYCVPLLQRGAVAYSPELLLNGIIIQRLEFKRHKLFTNNVKGY